MKPKSIFIVMTSFLILLNFSSCGKWFWDEISCRDFEFEEDLAWYPGLVTDQIVFSRTDQDAVSFEIQEKFINHMISYLSDTGCSCWDVWGIGMKSGDDTIQYWGGSSYIYDQEAEKYDRVFISINGVRSGFPATGCSVFKDTTVESIHFDEVRKFTREAENDDEFTAVYTGRGIGIIKMEKKNGEVWLNMNPVVRADTVFESFNYTDLTCQ